MKIPLLSVQQTGGAGEIALLPALNPEWWSPPPGAGPLHLATCALGHLKRIIQLAWLPDSKRSSSPPCLPWSLLNLTMSPQGLEAWLGSQPHCSEVVLKIPDSGAG